MPCPIVSEVLVFSIFVFSPFPIYSRWAGSRFCQHIILEFSTSSFLHSWKSLKNVFIGTLEYSVAVRRDSGGFEIHQKSNVSSKPLGFHKLFPHIWHMNSRKKYWILFWQKYTTDFCHFFVEYIKKKNTEKSLRVIG